MGFINFVYIRSMTSQGGEVHRDLLIDLLIVLFGVSSWVAVNGVWVELPVLVRALPEKWKLSSYVVITTQVANLGPIAFSLARKKWSQKVLEVPLIHSSLAVAFLSCLTLSFTWDRTVFWYEEFHSVAFLVLTFLMSCVDCTSSLLYLPFIANFKEQYVLSYMIGAGFSGPFPGFLALGQGVGGYTQCINTTFTNFTESGNITMYKLEAYYPPPRFPVSVFFIALAGQMILSWIAFLLLNKLPRAKKERVSFLPKSRPSNPALKENFQSSIEKDLSSSIEKTSSDNLLKKPNLTFMELAILLGSQGFISALYNGILLSVQTYSCLPYGSIAFHLAVTLSSIANPICCFIAIFLPITKVKNVVGFTIFGAFFGAYILTTALLSPDPPLARTSLGSVLVVLAWVIVSGTVAFVKACIATILRREGGQVALYKCGVVTQIGSAIGAITTFSLIQFTSIFQAYSPCS